MKTILISGQNGFLGSHLIRNLYKDYTIIGLDLSYSDNFRVKDILPEIISYNIDKIEIEQIFGKHKIDIIIHTATYFGNDGDLMKVFDSNLKFPLQLLKLGIKFNILAFINTDTFYATDYGALKFYSLSKKQFTEWAKLLSDNIKIINLKIGIIFGPKDNRGKFTVSLIQRMLDNEPEIDLTKGFQKRNFLFVTEAARIYRTIIEKLNLIELQYGNYNIGSGESISIRDYITKIHALIGSKSKLNFGAIEYRENEIMNPDNDISEVLQLGWTPVISIDEALRLTIEYEKSIR